MFLVPAESDPFMRLQPPVEMVRVENLLEFPGTRCSFRRIARDRLKMGKKFFCGKTVNYMWSSRNIFAQFSLATVAPFRQNPPSRI